MTRSGVPEHGRLIRAVHALRRGALVAYPTEAVYGLGCDPFDARAVGRLRALKRRPNRQGLLLIASELGQVRHLLGIIDDDRWPSILSTWPGPTTWVFPASRRTPSWLCADDGSLAVRITAHPVARALCRTHGGPIVSTSANRRGRRPAETALEARLRLRTAVAVVVGGPTGPLPRPTPIYRAIDGVCLRA